MADPLSILIGGGSKGHQQREAQIAEAAGKADVPATPPAQAAPAAPATAPPAGGSTGRQSFLAAAATTPPRQNTASKTLLGQ